jgi:hypothetical protein
MCTQGGTFLSQLNELPMLAHFALELVIKKTICGNKCLLHLHIQGFLEEYKLVNKVSLQKSL